MTVRQTSLIAYRDLQPKLRGKQQIVYAAIQQYPDQTDFELTRLMGKTNPDEVRPRRNELVKLGCVVCSGKRVCSVTGKLAYIWHVKGR